MTRKAEDEEEQEEGEEGFVFPFSCFLFTSFFFGFLLCCGLGSKGRVSPNIDRGPEVKGGPTRPMSATCPTEGWTNQRDREGGEGWEAVRQKSLLGGCRFKRSAREMIGNTDLRLLL